MVAMEVWTTSLEWWWRCSFAYVHCGDGCGGDGCGGDDDLLQGQNVDYVM